MKLVSSNFLTSWTNKGRKFAVQRIDYKRRYWNGAAMVYESAWQSLTMPGAQFKSIGTMSWTLDSVLQQQFKSSVCALQLLNNDYRWSPNNSAGVFGIDAVATTGYTAVGTKFQIYAGYELADGTTESIVMFTGVLSDYSMRPSDGIFEALISGLEYNLQHTDAQQLYTTVTNESIGPGDTVKTAFPTTSTGVAFVDSVKVNSVLKVDGTDYSVAGLDTPSFGTNGPATVNFLIAPAAVAVTWSGKKWLAAQKIEDLVTSLLVLAGFTSDQYSVQAVSFPNGVVSSFLLNTKALFDAGVAAYADTLSVSAGGAGSDYIQNSPSVIDDFESGFSGWTASGSGNLWSADIYGTIKVNDVGGFSVSQYISKASSKASGMWMIRLDTLVVGTVDYTFMSSTADDTGNGYVLRVETFSALGSAARARNITLYRKDAGALTQVGSTATIDVRPNVIWLGTPFGGSSYGLYMAAIGIMRDSSGNFTAFGSNNGDMLQQSFSFGTDNTYTTSSYVGLKASYSSPGQWPATGATICDLFTFATVDAAKPYSKYSTGEQNAAGVLSWTTIGETAVLTGATLVPLFSTKVATASGGTYDAAVDASLIPATTTYSIGSAAKQYMIANMYLRFDPANYTAIDGAQVRSISISYNTNTTTIALANFRNMNCWDAIQKLAFVADYEIGFDGSGTFFFRAKNSSSTSLLTFKQTDILSQIAEIKPGWNEVINDSQVTFGSSYGISRGTSYKEYSYLSLPEAHPSSFDKFSQRLDSQSVTDFLFSNDGNIAVGMAQAIHDDNYLEKRRITMVCRLIPHLDIGDIITVSFYEDPLLENNYFGDPLINWIPIFGTPQQVALRTFKGKVLNLTHDFNNFKSRMLVQEVLT